MQFASHFTCWGETSFYKYVELFSPDVCDLLCFYGDPRCMNRKPEHIQQDICDVHLERVPNHSMPSVLNDDPV